jgi:hypothetical protein
MSERTRRLSAAAFFLFGVIVMTILQANLPRGAVSTDFLMAALSWYVFYPVARLTWARSMAQWRYWLIGVGMSVAVPVFEQVRRSQLGPGPSPVLAALTLLIIGSVAITALVRMHVRGE